MAFAAAWTNCASQLAWPSDQLACTCIAVRSALVPVNGLAAATLPACGNRNAPGVIIPAAAAAPRPRNSRLDHGPSGSDELSSPSGHGGTPWSSRC